MREVNRKNKNLIWLGTGVLLWLAAGALRILAEGVEGFGEWYAATVYPLLEGSIGRFFGIFPWSAAEIGLYLLIMSCLAMLIVHRRQPVWLLARTVWLTGVLIFLYMANCGVNYYRYPFSAYLGWEIRESSAEELYDLCDYLTGQVNAMAKAKEEAEAAGSGEFALNSRQLAEFGREAMAGLGRDYPQLAGYYPKPKGLLVSRILSVQQLAGIYSPFTIEANYNREMTGYNIPHTICHELSHLKGFMREDEANFIGYLACITSESRAFQYSGWLSGWIYATNALARTPGGMKAYMGLYQQLEPSVIADLQENNLFWDRFDGKVAEVSNKMNDTYLKINDQADGVQSYGRVVDLLLAYFRLNH